jgi:hypothetical protein
MPKRRKSPVREFEKELGALLGDITRLGPRAALTASIRLLRELERALLGEKE